MYSKMDISNSRCKKKKKKKFIHIYNHDKRLSFNAKMY